MFERIVNPVSLRNMARWPALAALALAAPAWAHQCPPGMTIASQYGKAERAFLAYVVETRLEEDVLKQLEAKSPGVGMGEEHVKLMSAGYRVIEEFKGDRTYQPRLVDLLGIGTGYVGLTPGVYYLVLLPPKSSDDAQLASTLRRVDACDVPLSHHRLAEKGFQDKLNELRSLARAKP